MYKVLIVDDESAVREGLKAIIPWEKYGFEIAALAKDGQSALDRCKEEQFDLIISDIRMGQIDGIQLIKQIRSFDTRIQCLILTGYADFTYAKQAIEYNVAGYLLKPIEEENLIPALQDIKRVLDKEQAIVQLTVMESKRKQEAFVLSYLTDSQEESVQERLLLDEYRLQWPSYRVLLIKLEHNKSNMIDQTLLKLYLSERFQDMNNVIFFTHGARTGVVLNNERYRNHDIQQLYKQMEEKIRANGNDCTVAVGSPVQTLADLKNSYQVAVDIIEKAFFFPKNQLLRMGNEVIKPANMYPQSHSNLKDVMDKLYLALEAGELHVVESTFDELHQGLTSFYSEEELKRQYVYVMTMIVTKLQKAKPDLEACLVTISEQIINIYRMTHYQDLQPFVKNLFEKIEQQYDQRPLDDQLKKLLALIECNYHENLKLEKLAELFNYNSAYLGKLFKSHTGEYFNTYLDKVRIRNAKKLLLQGLKVYRVAEEVGYNNVDYFHSKFKRYVGISPSAYRRKEKSEV